MKVIDVDNNTIFIHKYGNTTYCTDISLSSKESDISIKFNPTSSVYDDSIKDNPDSAKQPVYNNMWIIYLWDKYPKLKVQQ